MSARVLAGAPTVSSRKAARTGRTVMGEVLKEPAYIALHSCGGWRVAIVDEPAHVKDTAKEITRAIRRGYSISRVECEDVRSGKVRMCKCRKERKSKQSNRRNLLSKE